MDYEPVIFIHANLPNSDYYSNLERANALRLDLINKGLSFTGIKINGLGGFMVVTDKLSVLRKLAVSYDQDFIYFSDENREVYKINVVRPKAKENLGKLIKLTNHVNLELGRKLNLTFIENGTQYVYSTEQ